MSTRDKAWALLPAITLGACSGLGPERAFLGAGKVNPAGVNHLIEFEHEPIESKELVAMICPPPTPTPAPGPDDFVGALACFHRNATGNEAAGQRLRNDIQHVIMLRSEQNCSLWKTYLQRGGAINRGTFNVLSVLTGGAGAVVEGQAASILAAVSGAAAGTGAAIDEALLHGLTEGLVFPKVDEVRKAQREAIEGLQGENLTTYSLMRALSDAVRYHAACNISTALSADTPGAQFGNQIRTLTVAANDLRRASIAFAGASSVSPNPPTAADIKNGATFLTTEGDVLTVSGVPGTAGKTDVAFTKFSAGKATEASEAADAFAKRIADTVLLKAGK